ncbi:MAG: peptide chain release factor N(5)-glutamine methyltransferase [Alphaproteobacteria bacterium]|nr:peptide chain release factor N(5)-glutamine methyltransferase [Alphaproteobacteria bacterium]
MLDQAPLLIKEYGARLSRAGVKEAHQQAFLILSRVPSRKTSLDQKTRLFLENAFLLRERRMPIERIFGTATFYDMPFFIRDGVATLSPETEHTVHQALLSSAKKKGRLRILDLGTGTGCMLLALLEALPQATGVGVDLNEKAVDLARENARLNGLLNQATFRVNDWGEGLNEKFDLIVSNPPHVATAAMFRLAPEKRDYDPAPALDGGNDGLAFFKKTAETVDPLLKKGGLCLCQIDPSHAFRVEFIFRNAGFKNVRILRTARGKPCCVAIEKNEPGKITPKT